MTKIKPILVVAGIVSIGGAAWLVSRAWNGVDVLQASGTVEATNADLGFLIAGRVERIAVRLGDLVARGDTLARLDTREVEARLASARAQLAAATARLRELQTGFRSEEIAQARAATLAAERRRENAQSEVERTAQLFEGGAVSRETLEQQETVRDVAAAEYDRTAEALRLVQTGPRPEEIAAAQAAVHQAEANVTVIEVTLDNATVTAPFAGRVSTRHREPGEIVNPGAPVVSLTNLADRWVRVYIRENAIGRLTLGDSVTITADTHPDRRYTGEVVFIADEAEFTPSNVQTTEERVKLVFEVRVRIRGDVAVDLKPGIAADVNWPSTVS